MAQSDLLERFPNISVLSSDQATMYTKLSNVDRFSSAKLIKVKDLATNLNPNGNLSIVLSADEFQQDECQNLEFAPRASRYVDDQNYSYYGMLVEGDTCGCKCQSGEILLEAKNGRRYGYIVADEVRFEILALGNGYSIMARVDQTFFNNKAESLALPQTPPENKQAAVASRNDNPCPIRVLFLYTKSAEDAFGVQGLDDMANLGISQANIAFSNSVVDDVLVERANFRKWAGFNEDPLDPVQDMQDLITDPIVAQWRQTDLADVVCLITSAGYAGGILGASGFMPDPANPGQFLSNLGNPMSNLSFMFVEGISFSANFTFTHELGHLMGCRHQICDIFENLGCDDAGSIEHGHGWTHRPCWLCKKRRYSTVMHQLRDNTTRLLQYSNPDINYKGATGIVDESNNAKWIKDGNGCTVAEYLTDPMIYSVEISGTPFICQYDFDTYTADVSWATGSVAYEWHTSTNGVAWGNPVGIGASINVYANNAAAGSSIFIRVKVTDQTGAVVFGFLSVNVKSSSSFICSRIDDVTGGSSKDFIVLPNPTDGVVTLQMTGLEDGVPVSIRLFSATGALLKETTHTGNRDILTEPFSLQDLPNGLYLLQARIGTRIFNEKILKQ